MTDKPHRIMLVEDNPAYRSVVERAIERDPQLVLAEVAGTAERAISILQDAVTDEAPHVILLDLNLPGISGIDAIPQIKKLSPVSRIIALTQSDHEADVVQAITCGASGYLLKSSTIAEIKDAIHLVIGGGAMLDARVAKYIVSKLQETLPCHAITELLTQRESEVLYLLAEGQVKKEIARQLDISYNTVVTHVAHIYEKLGVQNSPAAVAKAFRMGLFPR